MVDTRIEEKGIFKPRYYIIVDHTGDHFRLILYNNKVYSGFMKYHTV